jgi:hypothetical protein
MRVVFFLLVSLMASGQSFDVASIKPNHKDRAGDEESRREKIDAAPGTLTMRNVSLRSAMKLESRKGPFEILIVDHAEKTPTEN